MDTCITCGAALGDGVRFYCPPCAADVLDDFDGLLQLTRRLARPARLELVRRPDSEPDDDAG